MRVVMMGTGPFAVPTFQMLLDSAHEVVSLVTQPARPAHGRRPPPKSPMRQVAEEHGIAVFDPTRINDAASVEQLRDMRADLLVVCDYGQILRPEALAAARLGGINLHGSLLPKYRGAAPVQWALIQGESETGVSVIHMTPKLDAGPILVQARTPIGPDEDAVELELRLAEMGAPAVASAIEQLAAWDGVQPIGVPQDPALATRAPRFRKEDGNVDWTLPATVIHRRVRGLVPWPGTYTHWLRGDGAALRLIVQRVSLVQGTSDRQPGAIVETDRGRLLVQTGGGTMLSIDRLQPAGKRSMTAHEFLLGHALRPGDRLGTPES